VGSGLQKGVQSYAYEITKALHELQGITQSCTAMLT